MKTEQFSDGAYQRFHYEGIQNLTPEALLESKGLNLDEWVIVEVRSKTWEMGRKDKKVDLQWEGNQTTGTVLDTGEIFKVPLHSLSVTARPKVLEPSALPSIRPVRLRVTPTRKAPASRRATKLAVIIFDAQVGYSRNSRTGVLDPFHDRRVMDLFLQLIERVQPDRVVYGGDMLDLPDWSDKFLRSPDMYFTTQPAIEELAWWAGRAYATCPTAQTDWMEGNHGARMEKALQSHLVAAHGLRRADEVNGWGALSIPNLLALDSLGATYHPYSDDSQVWLGGALRVVHGNVAKAQSGATAGALANNSQTSVMFGHVHRIERAARTLHTPDGPRVVEAISPGCACRVDGAVPGSKRLQNWQQGLAVVEYDESWYHVEILPIVDGRTTWRGAKLEARGDVVENLKREVGDWGWD